MIFSHKNLSTKILNLVNKSYSYSSETLESIFFRGCYLCGVTGSADQLICKPCENDLLKPLQTILCSHCKIPLGTESWHPHCPECRLTPPSYDTCTAVTTFEFPASTLVHQLKYQNKQFVARLLGRLLAEQLSKTPKPRPDLICAVPMHSNQRNTRRYNHADEIAKHSARLVKSKFSPHLLVKTRDTESQSSLGRVKRINNLKNSLSVNASIDIKGKHIAVVDDVMTTGATFDYVAQLLKANGAGIVEVWAFARTPKPRQINARQARTDQLN